MEKENKEEVNKGYIDVEYEIHLEFPGQLYQFDIREATRQEIEDFVNETYLNNENKLNNVNEIRRDDLLMNLIDFKTYRDELEVRIINYDKAKDMITFFISVFTAFVAVLSLNNIELKREVLYILFLPLVVYTIFRLFLDRRESSYNSLSYKLVGVNYAVHVLEIILEEMNRVDEDEAKIIKNIEVPLKPDKNIKNKYSK